MRYYSKEHLWIDIEGNCATIGICKYFLVRSGSITWISSGETGKKIQAGDLLLTLENDKSAIDFPAPVTGLITESNAAILEDPALLDGLSELECWICKVEMTGTDVSSLMTNEEYETFTS